MDYNNTQNKYIDYYNKFIKSNIKISSKLKNYLINLSNLKYFFNLLKNKKITEFEKIITKLSLIKLKKNTVIFNVNDEADGFYIILKGAVEIWLNKFTINDDIIIKEENNEFLNLLKEGDTFGDYGILKDLKRSASAITSNKYKNTYLGFLKKSHFIEILEYLNISKTHNLIETLSSFYKTIISYNEWLVIKPFMNKYKYDKRTVLFKKDEKINYFYIILAGSIRLTDNIIIKKIDFGNLSSKVNSDNIKMKEIESFAKNKLKINLNNYYINYEVSICNDGFIFGLYELENNIEKYLFNGTILSEKCKILKIKISLFNKLKAENSENIFTKLYNEIKCNYNLFIEKKNKLFEKWKIFKNQIKSNDIVFDEHKRYNKGNINNKIIDKINIHKHKLLNKNVIENKFKIIKQLNYDDNPQLKLKYHKKMIHNYKLKYPTFNKNKIFLNRINNLKLNKSFDNNSRLEVNSKRVNRSFEYHYKYKNNCAVKEYVNDFIKFNIKDKVTIYNILKEKY